MTQALWVLCLLLLAAGYIAAPSGPVLAAGLAALMLPVLSWLAVLLWPDAAPRWWASR